MSVILKYSKKKNETPSIFTYVYVDRLRRQIYSQKETWEGSKVNRKGNMLLTRSLKLREIISAIFWRESSI